MRNDIRPGAIFPDYELVDHTGTRRHLGQLQDDSPMILVLSRGGYCPKDHHQNRLFVDFSAELEVGYAKLVTVSTDTLGETREWRARLGAHWTFLSDPERQVQQDLDIAEYTDPRHNPMIPHTLVLAPGLVVYKVYNGYWFFGRPTIEELRHDLRAVSQAIRPDWDITAPELRAAWQLGDRRRFFPYDKARGQGRTGPG